MILRKNTEYNNTVILCSKYLTTMENLNEVINICFSIKKGIMKGVTLILIDYG